MSTKQKQEQSSSASTSGQGIQEKADTKDQQAQSVSQGVEMERLLHVISNRIEKAVTELWFMFRSMM